MSQPLFDTVNHQAHQQELGSTLSELTNKCATTDPDSHPGDTILQPAHSQDPTYDPEKGDLPRSGAEASKDDTKNGGSSWHLKLKKFLTAGTNRLSSDAAYYHYGNYVIDRKTGSRKFEQMPLYTRIGMHILYHGTVEETLLGDGYAQKLFTSESVKMGTHFDSPDSKPKIATFIKQFNLDLSDLAEPDPTKYKCFNDFFARGLKPNARPPAEPQDEGVLVSSADCRLVVFQTLKLATEYWIKGKRFSIPNLLASPDLAKSTSNQDSDKVRAVDLSSYDGGAIAIFRLAPQDYHRWHSPISGTVVSIVDIPGTLMTVNPMAINENLNVYTQNKRSICYIKPAASSASPVLVVAIGAMLVGSIKWSIKAGQTLKKGEEMGEFRYGGSTVLMITPRDMGVVWDDDLVSNSRPKDKNGRASETQMRVGDRIGRVGR